LSTAKGFTLVVSKASMNFISGVGYGANQPAVRVVAVDRVDRRQPPVHWVHSSLPPHRPRITLGTEVSGCRRTPKGTDRSLLWDRG